MVVRVPLHPHDAGTDEFAVTLVASDFDFLKEIIRARKNIAIKIDKPNCETRSLGIRHNIFAPPGRRYRRGDARPDGARPCQVGTAACGPW